MKRKPDFLVTLTISIDRDMAVFSDVQTHDNSFSEVAKGIGAIKKEVDRVISESRKCPHFPKSKEDARKKVVRTTECVPCRGLEKFTLPLSCTAAQGKSGE